MCMLSVVMDYSLSNPWEQNKETMEKLVEILTKAKAFDELTHQKDCELESKKQQIQKLADDLGVSIHF